MEFSKNSTNIGDTSGKAKFTYSGTQDKCTCNTVQEGAYYYYVITPNLVASLSCSSNKTSGDCTGIPCQCYGGVRFVPQWAKDCKSFTVGGDVYKKSGGDSGWFWTLLVVGALLAVAAAAIGGAAFFIIRKRRAQYTAV